MRSPRSTASKIRATAASIFGKRKGSPSERSRGTRKASTSSADLKRLRFSSSTIQGSPQISAQLMSLAASAHAGAMIQFFSKKRRFKPAVSFGGFKPPLLEGELYSRGFGH